MVPHYQSCLLVWCHTTGHAFWSFATAAYIYTSRVQTEVGWLQVCATLTGVPLHQTSADPVSLSDMPACTVQLYQTCMLDSFIQLHMCVKCFSIPQGIWSVANPLDMLTVRVPLPRVFKICRQLSLKPSCIYQMLSDT